MRRTLEICIDPAGADGVCPVQARVLETNESARSFLQVSLTDDDLARAARQLAQGLAADGGASGAYAANRGAGADSWSAEELGARLFDALFTGPVAALYGRINNSPARPLAFWLIVDDPQMAQIPWELLFDRSGRGFLALSGPFARGISSSRGPVAAAQRSGPLRVLMAAAFPVGLPGPETAAEFEQVGRNLGYQAGSGVQLVHLPHATAEGVRNALREAQMVGTPYDVFHIICHGVVDPATGNRVLVLEDEESRPVAVTAAGLTALLQGQGVQAVFLNACAAAAVSAGDLAPTFAQTLLGSDITLMVGMQAPVRMEDAVYFAAAFYAALADGRSADQALLDVRSVAQVRDGDGAAAAIPVCYTRILPAFLRPPPMPPPEREWQWPWWRRAWRWTAAAAVLLVSLIGGYLTLREFLCGTPLGTIPLLQGPCAVAPPPLSPPPTVVVVAPTVTPTPWLTGDIKIAVADFAVLDGSGSAVAGAQGAEMAQHLYASLRADLAEGTPSPAIISIDVPPAAVGPITGANLPENAARRAETINADMLIYGTLEQEAAVAALDVYFYLAPNQLTYAEELADVYPLLAITSQGDLQSNAVTRSDLRGQLLAQARGVADLILGMGHFNRQEYGDAQQWLVAADTALAATGSAKRAVTQLFLGSTAAQQGDMTLAHQYFDTAYNLDRSLARALIGRGQTVFLQARDGCTSEETDIAGIKAAIADYEEAGRKASNPLAAITTKANLNLGTAYFCLAMAGEGDENWSRAQEHLNYVVDDYAADENPRLRYLAALAHERLGALAIGQASRAGGPGGIDAALIEEAGVHFEEAAALSLEPGNQASVHLWLAWIAAFQRRCSAAQEELRAARTAFDARRELDSQSLAYQSFRAEFNSLYNGSVQPLLAQRCAP